MIPQTRLVFSPRWIFAIFSFMLGIGQMNAKSYNEVTDMINWKHPGLEAGAAAVEEGRHREAMKELLQYYRAREQEYHFDLDEPLRNLEGIAEETHDSSTLEDVMRRRFTFEQETVQFDDGIDWTHEIYDPEWAYMFHRQTHFRTLVEG